MLPSPEYVYIYFSDAKLFQINVDIGFSCTVGYVLGGIICRGRLRPLLQVYTKQFSAHREGEQEMNLQAQAHAPIFYSLLHFGLILLAGPGSMGCSVQSAVLHHLNIAEHLVSCVGLQTAIPF
jgi:hypothetical protein